MEEDDRPSTSRRGFNERDPQNRRRSTDSIRSPQRLCADQSQLANKRKRDDNNEDCAGSKRATTHEKNDRRSSNRFEIVTTSSDQPKQGSLIEGEKIVKMKSNYFILDKLSQWQLNKYHVTFSDKVESVKFRYAMLAKHSEMLGNYIFNGEQLFTVKHLGDSVRLESTSFKEETIEMTLKYTGTVELLSQEGQQIQNLILRRAMKGLQLTQIGRNYFDPEAAIQLCDHQIKILPGYLTSIRLHQHQILMCAEITHKVTTQQTVRDILLQEWRNNKQQYKENVSKVLLGRRVWTKYNNKVYRIDDIDFNGTPESEFKRKNVDMSFIEYYQQRWNITIRDRRQPLIVTRATEKSLRGGAEDKSMLVPELCYVTGLTDAQRNNFQLMRGMKNNTNITPSARVAKLLKFNDRLQNTVVSQDVLRKWNMTLSNDLVRFDGRLLASHQILFGGQSIDLNCRYEQIGNWDRHIRNQRQYQEASLRRWSIIYPRYAAKESMNLFKNLKTAAIGMRFDLGEPHRFELYNDRNDTLSEQLNRCANENPQLILCVVGKDNSDCYATIKKLSFERAIATQVVVLRTLRANNLLSIATKVAVQMCCKIGGIPWHVRIPEDNLLMIGYDVAKDTIDKNKMYGALVASMVIDGRVQYFSCVNERAKGDDMNNNVGENIIKGVREYARLAAGSLPGQILVYRDGVGDGQMGTIKETEVALVKAKLNAFYGQTTYTLTYIVVSKRINTRLFLENNANPEPGTVVDDVITLPERYDFYLISQLSRHGTVSPTRYDVLLNETTWKPNQIQRLTYISTHLYYNWAGTVRVPAVCKYASKLAFMVSQYVHKEPRQEMGEYLHYI